MRLSVEEPLRWFCRGLINDKLKNVMKTNRTIAGRLTLLARSSLNLQPSTAFAQPTVFNWRNLCSNVRPLWLSLPHLSGLTPENSVKQNTYENKGSAMKMRLFSALVSILVLSTAIGLADSYTIGPLNAGVHYLIANQLDHTGGNSLTNVFGKQLPDATFVYFWKGSGDDPANAAQLSNPTNYDIYIYDSTVPNPSFPSAVWFQEDDFTPINANSIYVNPGQGMFIVPGATVTLTFTGTPHVPVLPAALPYGAGHWNLLSRQTNDVGTYENVIGLAPAEGTRVFRWNVPTQTFTTNNYSGGAWSSGAPNLGVGEAAFFLVPYSTTNSCLTFDGL